MPDQGVSADLGQHAHAVVSLNAIVVDDNARVRRRVRDALQAGGIAVIAEASTGREAVELTLRHRPDAVLMDVVMPGMDGISATRRIVAAAPDQRVILLTASDDDDMALAGLRSGAAGFLTKDQSVDALPRALRGVARGEAAISRRLAARLIEYLRKSSPQ